MANITTEELKAKAEELVKKITDNKDLMTKFKSDPKAVVKSLVKDKVSDDILDKITEIVKTKINVDSAKSAISTLKGLFGK